MPPRDYFKAGSERLLSLFEEIQHASDRIAAVSAAAFVDDTLAHVMMEHFIKLGKSWEDKLFHGPASPLGTFSAKITIGYAMGLFGPLTRADLDIIRTVRNDFAHSAMPLTFIDSNIIDKCNKLTTPIRIVPSLGTPFVLEKTPKAFYVQSANHIAWNLYINVRSYPPEKPGQYFGLLP